jgi:small subunit ribosomal protein S6
MHFYELLYILNPVLSEEDAKTQTSNMVSWMEANGAKIDKVDDWGLKRLAYPIQKKKSGFYVNIYFEAPGTLPPALDRQVRINESFMRHLCLKYDKKALAYYRKGGDAAPEAAESTEETAA